MAKRITKNAIIAELNNTHAVRCRAYREVFNTAIGIGIFQIGHQHINLFGAVGIHHPQTGMIQTIHHNKSVGTNPKFIRDVTIIIKRKANR